MDGQHLSWILATTLGERPTRPWALYHYMPDIPSNWESRPSKMSRCPKLAIFNHKIEHGDTAPNWTTFVLIPLFAHFIKQGPILSPLMPCKFPKLTLPTFRTHDRAAFINHSSMEGLNVVYTSLMKHLPHILVAHQSNPVDTRSRSLPMHFVQWSLKGAQNEQQTKNVVERNEDNIERGRTMSVSPAQMQWEILCLVTTNFVCWNSMRFTMNIQTFEIELIFKKSVRFISPPQILKSHEYFVLKFDL